MKLTNAVALTITLFASVILPSVAQEALPRLLKKVKPAVVTILAYHITRAMPSFGTGFFVAPDRVVTARHVLADCQRAEVKTSDGKYYRIKSVLADDELWDVVLVQLATPVKHIPPLTVAKHFPKEGEQVFLVGSPLGLDWTISTGIVSGRRSNLYLGQLFQMTAPASPGNSGGPVFDYKGQVLGVYTLSLTQNNNHTIPAGQNLNFAMPGSRIIRMIAASKSTKPISFQEWSSKIPLDWDAVSPHIDSDDMRPIETGNSKNALPFFINNARRYPNDAYAWFFLGRCWDNIGRSDEAINAYNKAISIKPDFATAYNNLATIYNNFGTVDKYNDALKTALKSVEFGSQNAQNHATLGVAYFNLNRNKEAIDSFNQAISLDSKSLDAHHFLGLTYNRLGRYIEASDELRQASHLAPDSGPILAQLGGVYETRSKYEEALDNLQQALSLGFDQSWVNKDLGDCYYNLGYGENNKDAKNGLYGRAVDAYNKALTEDPKNAGAYAWRGYTYLLLKEFSEAADDFNKSKSLGFQAGWVDEGLGEAYVNLGDAESAPSSATNLWSRAKDASQKAIKSDPNDWTAYAVLGSAFVRLHRNQDALNSLNHAFAHKDQLSKANQELMYLSFGRVYVRYRQLKQAACP